MSDSSSPSPRPSRKRKHVAEEPLEIDLNAPEPASKKALRKEKKAKLKASSGDATEAAAAATETTEQKQQQENKDKQAAETSNKKQRTGFGVWIGNLPFTATREALRTFLTTKSGILDSEITRIHIPEGESKQKGVKRNKGFAYVDFTSQKVVDLALALSEELVGGRRVLIKDATNFEGRPEKKPEQQADGSKTAGNPPSNKIFVGNLSFDTTKEDLEEHFSPCGVISNVHVATFEDSGKCKGYAWVEFEATESSEAAVRGFVKIPDPEEEVEEVEEDADEEAEGSSTKKPKKQRMKKVWVNRLQGRQLRMEFAEDSTTRYKKRFGKEKTEGDETSKQTDEKRVPQKTAREPKKPTNYNSRYSNETVQRLNGAIVESKGSKVTFD